MITAERRMKSNENKTKKKKKDLSSEISSSDHHKYTAGPTDNNYGTLWILFGIDSNIL